ncbi:putative anti-sigma regulatory factor, serine/threonine protein kinase [Catenulispora acidiphila DSM 44928]|uniref:Putative anti-sigma regulatory factor, serine/threonine protein kinase n=1 Tax=Catenulispora acidiphila (strain DSM 44928 / JCM 14897 / NBRC 102108 / NRRL B-24433 / ID139908) TaxID=479433 RepID=C7QFN5_CATAD|nr:ATP-binding protein [Catenulispora acidiphila]ACU68974.1 putative anti-sigma regulatory factor, serine/threonine protein kinase [Catenulispora acidiphila DSM 44928]
MSYWSRSFPGLAENLAEVRQFIQMVLGDAPGAELVVLAGSELAGNAIVHTASGAPGGQFVVHLAAFADRWQVRVDDAGSPTEPRVLVDSMDEHCDWDSESGRGLAMVASISRKWGVLGDRAARAVWAEIPCPVPPGGGIESVMSGGMLEALESVARALENENRPPYQELDTSSATAPATAAVPSVAIAPARWPGTMPSDPARAERIRRQASHAAFQRALIESAYAETLGPRPLPYWPPFPNPLALQGSSPGTRPR